ncbi:MAG: murein biosynthesis integral membrane protein MurJ, partial [Gammaproteobacteria bacterium]|nr:murein biosynthesis integral membrane protein MurJ [Gammaproteobacteria bacterium]
VFASFLPTGSISWLYYSDRLMQFPLGVFGVALSTVILPRLSKHVADQNEAEYRASLAWALRWVMVIALPAALAIMVLAKPLVSTFLHYGRFTAWDVEMTERSLIAFAMGLLFFIAVKVLVSGFYSRQDTKTPVKIAVICVLSNLVFNAVLMWPLGQAGLALATTLSALLNTILLWRTLKRRGLVQLDRDSFKLGFKVLIACVAMVLVLLLFIGHMDAWLSMSLMARVGHLTLEVFAGIGAYGSALWVLRFPFNSLRR